MPTASDLLTQGAAAAKEAVIGGPDIYDISKDSNYTSDELLILEQGYFEQMLRERVVSAEPV